MIVSNSTFFSRLQSKQPIWQRYSRSTPRCRSGSSTLAMVNVHSVFSINVQILLLHSPRSHSWVFWLQGVSIGLKNWVSFNGHVAWTPLEDSVRHWSECLWTTYSHRTSPIQSWLALSLWQMCVEGWNEHWSEQQGPFDGLKTNEEWKGSSDDEFSPAPSPWF